MGRIVPRRTISFHRILDVKFEKFGMRLYASSVEKPGCQPRHRCCDTGDSQVYGRVPVIRLGGEQKRHGDTHQKDDDGRSGPSM